MTAGKILLDTAAQMGWYGLMSRSFGPQIRGGEAAALLRIASTPIQNSGDDYDVLLAIDWGNMERFSSEIPLRKDSLLIADPGQGVIPDVLRLHKPRVANLPMSELARGIRCGRPNMVALGLLAGIVGIPKTTLFRKVETILGSKGEDTVSGALESVEAGFGAAEGMEYSPHPEPPLHAQCEHWNISGNEATALGAVLGGVRFVAAYPITPATDVLEWLASHLPTVGGTLVQAEDELAAVNMCLGASFGGIPSLTATSGPGFSLMTEGIGLAVASETPVVIVDVMRGGPSTGIPTKSEQTDLNIAVYGLHGDAPHVVLAPTGIGDCLFTTQWAVQLSEELQTPAIVLSDQSMGQARAIIDIPTISQSNRLRRVADRSDLEHYRRYALTEDGISAIAIPGTANGEYTADGLEHDEYGTPSAQAAHHNAQLKKRRHKLDAFDYGARWADIEGKGPLAVITWGSSTQVVREAIARAHTKGVAPRLVAIRLIAPAQPEQMASALAGCDRVLIVEQNDDGQFHRYLRAHYHLSGEIHAWHHPGPLPLRPLEVLEQILQLALSEKEIIA